jgi:hypothetical protein
VRAELVVEEQEGLPYQLEGALESEEEAPEAERTILVGSLASRDAEHQP